MFSIDVRPLVRPCLKVCETQEQLGMLLPPPWIVSFRLPTEADFLKQLLSATLSVFAPGLSDVL